MAELKTKPTKKSVKEFLNGIPDAQKRKDALTVAALMEEATGEKPKIWGASLVGYGSYHYVYATGREGDWPIIGFSPRKQNLTLYIMPGFERYAELMSKLGKYKTGKSCLYINRLEDIHMPTLKKLIQLSVRQMDRLNRAP